MTDAKKKHTLNARSVNELITRAVSNFEAGKLELAEFAELVNAAGKLTGLAKHELKWAELRDEKPLAGFFGSTASTTSAEDEA